MPPLPFHKSTVRRNGDCFSIITTTVRAAVSSSTDTTTRSDGSSNIINQGATLLPTSEGEDNFVRASFETHGPEKILPATITSEATNKASDNIRRTIVPMDLVVGHSLIKQALEIAAVTCTSLVISGPTGSCKSVLARSMQLLLPNNVSVVHVPVTAAEDALTGSVDLERSLETGTPVFQPGVLTKADGGILVMDDINLMDVSTASVLFKALGDGCVHVEREGMSVTYKCQPLVVVATYNDAYEELREHFIDRFAMQVSTSTSEGASIADRVQGVLNVEAFVDIGSSSSSAADREEVSSSPASSSSSYVQQLKLLKQAAADEQTRRQRIVNATERFSAVQISKPQLLYLCQLATTWDCEGQRAEMFAATAARAAAALDGRLQVEAQDLTLAAKLCIVPRGRLVIVPDDAATATTTPEDSQQQKPETQPIPPPPNMVDQEEQQEDDSSEMEESQQEVEPEDDLEQKEQEPLLIPEEFMFGVDCSIAVDPRLLVFQKRALGKGRRAGKRSRKFNIDRGRFVKAIFPTERRRGRLAVGATLRAAAPHQIFRRNRQALLTRRTNDKRVVFITKDDFRIQQLKKKTGSLVIFVVDASGSMALNRMAAAKG